MQLFVYWPRSSPRTQRASARQDDTESVPSVVKKRMGKRRDINPALHLPRRVGRVSKRAMMFSNCEKHPKKFLLLFVFICG